MNKFVKDALSELHNVTWPTKQYAIRISKITIWFVLISAVVLWFVDWVLGSWFLFISRLNPKNNIVIVPGTWSKLPSSWWMVDWVGTWFDAQSKGIETENKEINNVKAPSVEFDSSKGDTSWLKVEVEQLNKNSKK